MTDSARARWTTAPADASGPSSAIAISGVSGDAQGERADVLGRLLGRAGASLAQTLDERVEEARRHLLADLDLELAESSC